MIKHIDYLGLEYQKNPKWGGVWYPDNKKVILYDYPSLTIPYFKSTIVHEIVGHTFWDLAREWFRNDLIAFNELANKMPPVNQYCKDGLEKHGWKERNDETDRQLRALDKKYGIKKDEYGYSNLEEQSIFYQKDDLKKYEKELNEINDGKFIGNPSNEFVNRDSSSMTRYANEQHSAITEIMYDTLKDNIEKGADKKLIGKEDEEKLKVLWKKLHPKFLKEAGESCSPFNEAFVEDEHPRGQPDNAGQFVSKGGGSSKDALHMDKVEKYESSLEIEPKKEDVDKAVNIESKVIGGVFDFIKNKSYKDKVKWVETQGSFAKGTDLGSSDLDIFIGFDYSLSLKEIEKITLDIGKNVLEPISDTNKYRIKHGADKDYPESNVDNVEVQIIGTSDVTLDQIKKGFGDGGMKTATDRTPHHTRYMKKALKGKENEVRKVKKFFKEAGVYDSSIAKQGFSGFATEVLVDKLGSFGKVLEFFANFVRGKVIGDTDRKFDTPLVMVDPLDPNRNLAQAFSHSERDGNIAPNKNLARLIKTAKSLFKTGKLPKITKEKMPSLSVKFHVDNTIDNNEVYGELYSSALKMSATLKRNGYAVKTPKDRITEDFTIDVPRINVDYNEDTGEATLNFGLENFDKKKRYVGGIPEDFPKEKLQAFYDNHKGEKLVRRNGQLYAEQENEYPTAKKLMNAIVSREKKNASVGKLEEFIKQAVVTQVDKEYENITDKPSVTEAGTSAGAKKAWDKRGRGRKEQIPVLNPRKRDPTRVKLRKRDSPMKIQGKQRKYRHDPTSKILQKPEDFAGKQMIMKVDLADRYPKWTKEVGIEFIEEQIKRADVEWDGYDLLGIEMQEDIETMVKKRGGTVTYRAKATISTVEKLARLHGTKKNYKTIDDLKDKTGVRVVLEDIKDVYATVKAIKKYFREENPDRTITIGETTDHMSGKGHPDGTGYRGIHLIFKDKERGMAGEIQIRTKRQNLWSEVFHLAYKSEIKWIPL